MSGVRNMDNSENLGEISLSRRKFLGAAGSTAAVTILPGCKFVAGSGSNTIPEPPDFPLGIELYQQAFINWSRETKISGVWFCSPTTGQQVADLANWAKQHNYRLRPFGSGHGFAPTLLPRGHDGQKVLIINTHDYLNHILVNDTDNVKSVTCGAGAYIEDICQECEAFDLGFYHTTAPGGISIAGALAMNAHGAAVPMAGETLEPGHSWGSLSNLILSITAVVWNESQAQYTLKTMQRDDPEIAPFLTSLGRAFITDVTIQLGPNLKIRNTSIVDLTAAEVLSPPDSQTANSFANLSDQYGTIDFLYYPFNNAGLCWIKTWTVTPEKPENAREVFEPYSLTTGVNMTVPFAEAFHSALRTFPKAIVPLYNQSAALGVKALFSNDNPETKINDIWGSAYTTTLYVQPNTHRKTVAAWGVIVSRENMQRALFEFFEYLENLLKEFKTKGQFPYTGPLELRAHGLDNNDDVLIPHAVEPTFSGARPHPDHPEKDTIIWFAINNNVDQPHASEFNALLEEFFLSNYLDYGIVRPEWTKGYAYTADGSFGGAWTNDEILLETFPSTWRDGYPNDNNWDWGVSKLVESDPFGVFSNSHLDKLFPLDVT